MELAQARVVARQVPLGFVGNSASCLVAILVMRDTFSWQALLAMVLPLAVLMIGPGMMTLRAHDPVRDADRARRVLRRVLVDSFGLGVYWCVAMLVYLPHVEPGDASLLVVAAFFLAAGSAGILYPMRFAFLSYTLPIFIGSLCTAVRLIDEDGGVLLLMSILMMGGVIWMYWINWANFKQLVRRNRTLEALRGEAEAARRAEAAFVENLNHEIRNAVAGVVGYFDIARESRLTDAEHRTLIANARDASGLLLNLLSDLLDVARLSSGRTALSVEPFDVRESVRVAIVSASAGIRRRPITVMSAIDDSVPARLVGDDSRIRQILLNLVGNAIKFMTQGTIVVRAHYRDEASSGWLELAVADDGPGIALERQATMFERFSRPSEAVEPTQARRRVGSGLGLSICASLVDLMGGRIRVESQPGHGATFYISLPLARAQTDAPAAAPAVAGAIRVRSNFAVLIVDDMPMNLLVLGKMLEGLGCRVSTAQSGTQAVALCAQTTFDLVLMDIDMADMDGKEATRRIRAMPGPAGQVPIVAVTGFAAPEQVASILAAGMNDHALKPMRKAAVERLLARWVPDPARPPASPD